MNAIKVVLRLLFTNEYLPIHVNVAVIFVLVKFFPGLEDEFWLFFLSFCTMWAVALEAIKATNLQNFNVDFVLSALATALYGYLYLEVGYFDERAFLLVFMAGFIDVLFAMISQSQALREVIGFPGGYAGDIR